MPSQVAELLDRANAAYVGEAKTKDEVNAFKAEVSALKQRYVERTEVQALRPLRVMLAMPRYGPVERESDVAAFTSGLASSTFVVSLNDKMGSALPSGFNQTWADFVNGEFDYFALLHSDCAPRGQFLDTMLAPMLGFDVMHACVAIKDGRGLTSTAVGASNDQWAKHRRILVRELHELPETFTVADCIALGGNWPVNPCLCCNTGVLLVKKGPWCRRFPGFRFQDRIAATVDGKTFVPVDDPDWDGEGRVFSQFLPEDWDFGRWCHNAGLRVGGTRKVIVDHIGRGVYTTERVWGDWKTDEYFGTDYIA